MTSSLADLTLRISATDNASAILQRVAQEVQQQTRLLEASYGELATQTNLAAAAQEKGAASSKNASAAHKEQANILTKLGEQLKDIPKLAAGFALGNLGANIGMGIAERFKNAAEEIDTFGTAVRGVQVVTGASAESASAMVDIFQHFGLSGGDAANKLSRFERALSGTDTALDISASGGKRGQQILQELGVTFQDASGKALPMDQALLNLAARWQTLDAVSKNAAARGLFGGLGGQGSEQLNLILDQGRAGLEKLIDGFRQEGLILSQENVEDVTKFTYAHKALDDAFRGLSVSLGTAFMPSITATAAVIAGLSQAIISDLTPVLKGTPTWVGPATLAVVGFGLAWQAISFIGAPIWGLITKLATAIFVQGASASTAAAENVVLAGSESAVGAAATVAAPEVTALAGAGAAAAGAFATVAQVFVVAGAAIYTFSQPLRDALDIIAELKAGIANIPEDQMNPIQKFVAGLIKSVPDFKGVVSDMLPKFEIPHIDVPDIQTPTIPGAEGTDNGPSETALEAQAKAKKKAAGDALKAIQDEAAQRKNAFDLGELDNETTAMQAKLAADEAANNRQLLDYKQKIEDLDRNSVNYALKLQQLNQQDAVTIAKMAEDKLRAQADDLSYQENLLRAQARAARARGETVDMAALHAQVRDLHKQQIQDEPGLLTAEHNTALANRAKQGTDSQASLEGTALERAKLAIQQAMQPLEAAATVAKRAADDAQLLINLDKQRFEIAEQAHKSELITAQAAAKAADEAYQAMIAAAQVAAGGPNAAGGVGTARYGPLPAGVAGGGAVSSGVTVNINQQNALSGEADEDSLAQKTADITLSYLNSAAAQTNKPAYHGLPGAFATSTP